MDNPSATASTVVDGWLRTGDLGWIDQDGYVFLEGRASEMIKSGAYRISPKEVEELLINAESVSEAAVCGVPDELLGQVPIAFLVGRKSDAAEKEILRMCRRSLSSHKVPRKIIWIEELPKTASGKIKKHELTSGLDRQIEAGM